MSHKKPAEVFEEAKGLPKAEKKALYASMISVEDKLELYRLEKAACFTEESAQKDNVKEYISHSGKYILLITPYKTSSVDSQVKTWNYTLGQVYKIGPDGDKILISEIQRNYCSFPYVFVENHANGHDYLVCGEDYQGQTIVELDTGEKASWVPVMGGFCWVNMMPSPSGNLIAVDGCYWACPYEIKIFDFSNPLKVPFECYTDDFTIDKFNGWNADGSCSIEIEYEVRKSDGKPISELTEAEEDALNEELEPGVNMYDLYGYEKKTLVWSKF